MNKQKIIDFVNRDSRSQAEIFESIKNRLTEGRQELSKEESIEITKNVIRYFDILLGSSENQLDEEACDGNVSPFNNEGEK